MDAQTLIRLLADIGDDTESLAEFLRIYLDDSPQQLQAMAQGLADRDFTAMGLAAHTLKSTSASVGATTLAVLCAELSRQTQSGVTTGWPTLVPQIAAEFEAVRRALTGQADRADQSININELLRRIG